MNWYRSLLLMVLTGLATQLQAVEAEWSGNLSGELRYFPETPADARQQESNASAAFEPEYALEWENGRQSFVTRLFARWDQNDERRSHYDIREMMWSKAAEAWELRLGIGKVFWGVTEFLHLVDIINQSDAVENLDLEDKLGQPMINLAWIQDWGTVDFFVLPYFRERTFPDEQGRPRTQPAVDTTQAVYQSEEKEKHVDYALRWYHSIAEWDIGVSYFTGTSRDPRLQVGLNSKGEPVLVPYYDLINQISLDLQGTFDAWLWKLEALHRSGQGPAFNAITGGFEYTLYGVFGSSADLGLLLEYLYDDRGSTAPTAFEDDLFWGMRFALNDEQSSEVLAGQLIDRQTHAIIYNVEASRRFGDAWKVYLEARIFDKAPPTDPASAFNQDDYLQLEVMYYF